MNIKSTYAKKKIYFWTIFIILIGGLNYGFIGSFNIDLIKYGTNIFHPLTYKIIYIVIGICSVILLRDRDTYLPFLGDSVHPCGTLSEHIPNNYSLEINVRVQPNSYVVYWAAEPESDKLANNPDPLNAYHKYENSGVVKADNDGNAILKIRKPQSYDISNVGKTVTLKPHIHYRYCKNPGMLSKIFTKFV
jgi:uncharacterized membrane protein YuzA (DUF378 family)